MKPRLGPYVSSMRPSQRLALGGLLAVLILYLVYSGSYTVLRWSGCLVSSDPREYGESMFCNFGGETVLYTRGRYEIWMYKSGAGTPIRILRFFKPMIRIESAIRSAISSIP